jgi:hypothetical protein
MGSQNDNAMHGTNFAFQERPTEAQQRPEGMEERLGVGMG